MTYIVLFAFIKAQKYNPLSFSSVLLTKRCFGYIKSLLQTSSRQIYMVYVTLNRAFGDEAHGAHKPGNEQEQN